MDFKFVVGMPRQKKLNYIQRWRMNHKPVMIYLSLEEFNALKTLADSSGLSYRELIMNAVKDIKKLYDTLSQSILKHHVEEIERIKREYENKITELKAEYEVKVEEIRREYQARVKVYRKKIEELQAKAKELTSSSAKEAYDKGYRDGYQKGYQDGKSDGYRIGLTKCFGRK
jgi:DNA mismatch repair ATPase MutS